MKKTRDEDPTFLSMDPDPAQLKKKYPDPDPAKQRKKNPDQTQDPTFIRNEEKNIFIF